MTIPNIILYNPAPQFTDDNGNPLDNGQLQIFEASTNILKDIFADNTQNTPIENPVKLGSGGFTDGGVWIPEGNYDISIEKYIGLDENDDEEFERVRFRENIAGAGGLGGSGGGISTLDSIDLLRAVIPDTSDLIYLSGYYSSNGQGSGFFRWDTLANDIDDGGSVIAPNGAPSTGRWFRIFESPVVTMDQWGVRSGSEYTNATNIENMIAFAQNNTSESYLIDLNMPDVYLNGNVDFGGDISVIIRENCRFRGASGVHTLTLSCQNLTIESISELVEYQPLERLTLEVTSDIEVDPRWWGAPTGGITNSTIWMNECILNSGNNPIVIADSFLVNPVSFEGRKLIQKNGGYLSVGGIGISTFDEIEADEPFIFGDYQSISFLRSEVNGDWFDFDGVISPSRWADWIGSLVSNGPKVVTWVSGEYEFTSSYSSDFEDLSKITFKAEEGVLFKATGASVFVAMPKVLTKNYIFDNTSTGKFYFSSNNLDSESFLTQFGAVPNDETMLVEALEFAISCNTIVDLDRNTFLLPSNLNLAGFSSEIKIINGTFAEGPTFANSYLFAFDDGFTFDGVTIRVVNSPVGVIQLGSGVYSSFKDCKLFVSGAIGVGANQHFSEDGTLNDFSMINCELNGGVLYLGNRVNSGVISNNLFDDTISIIIDPDNFSITSNTFKLNSALDSIYLSIPSGQTDQRNGITIKNNVCVNLDRDLFVSLSDGNGSYGSNYHISVEDNIGTNVSTTYEFTYVINLNDFNDDSTGFFPISSLIPWDAMNQSGFFILTQFNYGLGDSTSNNYIDLVRSDFFNSGDNEATIAFKTPSLSSGDQTIYCSFRRSL